MIFEKSRLAKGVIYQHNHWLASAKRVNAYHMNPLLFP
jgi:hypothetical protein